MTGAKFAILPLLALVGASFPLAASAQGAPARPVPPIAIDDTVFGGDYLAVGLGVAVTPSYAGSDDYVFSPVPMLRGSVGGVDINPRGAGINLDFVPDGAGRVGLDLGLSARLRNDRANQIEDEVVARLGELDAAIEVGPSAGIGLSRVLNPYDGLSLGVDVMWDINGAHGGMVVAPSASYFTPLSRSTAALLSVGVEWADGDFHDYYFDVSASQSAAAAGVLPVYDAQGGGFTGANATMLLALDLNGDIADGGWGLFALAGYSRKLGDAADTPYTSVRGSANQVLGAFGVGYTF